VRIETDLRFERSFVLIRVRHIYGATALADELMGVKAGK